MRPVSRPSNERGATLLIAVAVLTLLAVFAVAFVEIMNVERRASTNYTDSVRARLLAQAGIERALVELRGIAREKHYSDPAGDNWHFEIEPGENLAETQTPSFRQTHTGAAEDTWGELTVTDESGSEEPLAYSGLVHQSYARGADIYKLKILDTTRQLDLNHRDHDSLVRMVKNLVRARFDRDEDPATRIATTIADAKPDTGFESKAEVKAAWVAQDPAAGYLSPDEWREMRDLVTVHSWKDSTVIRPWALNSVPEDLDDPDSEADAPDRQLSLLQRSPVNLNTAPFPVLVAMFAEAKAVTERYGIFEITYEGAQELAKAIIARREYPPTFPAELGTIPSLGDAGAGSGPFESWREFERFVDDLPNGFFTGSRFRAVLADNADGFFPPSTRSVGTVSGHSYPHQWRSEVSTSGEGLIKTALDPGGRNQGVRDLVKSVANPNSMVAKFGAFPNRGGGFVTQGGSPVVIPRLVDKSDITSLTTEGCFSSMGNYEITSAGVLLREDERAESGLRRIAVQTQKVVVHVFDVHRVTSQLEFEDDRALMAANNFFPAFESGTQVDWDADQVYGKPGDARFGVNKAVFGPLMKDDGTVVRERGFQGWPGVVSWPNYSLDRQTKSNYFELKNGYPAASWDGFLTLSNLIGYSVNNSDMVTGFARGKRDACKVRAWWAPTDQQSGRGSESDGGRPKEGVPPTHPADDFWAVNGQVGGSRAAVSDPDDDGVYDNPVDDPQPYPAPAGETELPETAFLGAPQNSLDRQPRLQGAADSGPSEQAVLDQVHGYDDPSNAGAMFDEGSSLWNSGVAIHGRRRNTNGEVQHLAYSGQNMDLGYGGTSIRFWVQPLVDPFLREEEVLFSFQGSDGKSAELLRNFPQNGAHGREVGFRVRKLALGSSVFIRLEILPNADTGISGAPPDRHWAAVRSNSSQPYLQLNVTPDGTGRGWVPGTWHRIVINHGPNEAHGRQEYSLTLQVDDQKSWEPNPNSGVLAYRGDPSLSSNDSLRNSFGEIHGHRTDGGLRPLTPENADASGVNGDLWLQPRLLGDWYHCHPDGAQVDYEQKSEVAGTLSWNENAGKYQGSVSGFSFPSNAINRNFSLSFSKSDEDDPDPPDQAPFERTSDPPEPLEETDVVIRPGGGGDAWYKRLSGDELGNDDPDPQAGGDHEWEIEIVATWQEPGVDPSYHCSCCGVCRHDTVPGGTAYQGVPTSYDTHGGDEWHCRHITKGERPSYNSGIPSEPDGYSQLPSKQQVCDDCHGCEFCDVDGPFFLGGEPAGDTNYEGPGDTPVAPVDPRTAAYAVFDNVRIANRRGLRTDWDPADGDPPPPKQFEDRYWETNVSLAVLSVGEGEGFGYGAIYHKGFRGLVGSEGTLGTLSWTAYPSSLHGDDPSQVQEFEVSAMLLEDGNSAWHPDNIGILNQVEDEDRYPRPLPGQPQEDRYYRSELGDASLAEGEDPAVPSSAAFGFDGRFYDGLGKESDSGEPELLLVGVRLRNLPAPPDDGSIAPGTPHEDVATAVRGALPSPQVRTPIFEDLTLTVIPEHSKVLYSEEGIEE